MEEYFFPRHTLELDDLLDPETPFKPPTARIPLSLPDVCEDLANEDPRLFRPRVRVIYDEKQCHWIVSVQDYKGFCFTALQIHKLIQGVSFDRPRRSTREQALYAAIAAFRNTTVLFDPSFQITGLIAQGEELHPMHRRLFDLATPKPFIELKYIQGRYPLGIAYGKDVFIMPTPIFQDILVSEAMSLYETLHHGASLIALHNGSHLRNGEYSSNKIRKIHDRVQRFPRKFPNYAIKVFFNGATVIDETPNAAQICHMKERRYRRDAVRIHS